MTTIHRTRIHRSGPLTRIHRSGPMAGNKNLNKPAFDAAAEKLRAMGHEVFNPASAPPNLSYRDALECNLVWICQRAQAIALLPGWRCSSGSKVEHALAVALQLDNLLLAIGCQEV